jgi:5-methylthioadenosine/S-adenosylhomocysteine deaminase
MIAGARELGVPITTHAAETRREVADVIAQWGASPIQTLHKIGALEVPLLAAHCVYVDEADMEIMSSTPFHVAHNPTSNLKLASGFAPVPQFLQRNITTGVATDSTASNNKLDIWQEMRLAALLHKATTGDPTAVSAQEALAMATREGAKCLGLESAIGSLEVGKKADVILVDFNKPHLTPHHSIVSHLVYAVNSSDVDTVLIDGRVLLHGGAFTELDADKICVDADTCARRLVAVSR